MNPDSINEVAQKNREAISDLSFQVKLFNGTPGLGALEQILVLRNQLADRVQEIRNLDGNIVASGFIRNVSDMLEKADKISEHVTSLQSSFPGTERPDLVTKNIVSDVMRASRELHLDLYHMRQELQAPAPAVDQEAARPSVSGYADESQSPAPEAFPSADGFDLHGPG